jgi:hypothetical protein
MNNQGGIGVRATKILILLAAAVAIHGILCALGMCGFYLMNPLGLTYLSASPPAEKGYRLEDRLGFPPFSFADRSRIELSAELQLLGFSRLGSWSTPFRQVLVFLGSAVPFLLSAWMIRPWAGRASALVHACASISVLSIVLFSTGLIYGHGEGPWRLLLSGVPSTLVRSVTASVWLTLRAGRRLSRV